MKKIIVGSLVVASTLLTACDSPSSDNKVKNVGMPNPASEYCIKKGGTLIPKKDKDGNEYSLCRLSNGVAIEEWEFFRKNNS